MRNNYLNSTQYPIHKNIEFHWEKLTWGEFAKIAFKIYDEN